MPAVDLTPYNQPQGSTSDGSKFDNLLAFLQSTLNGLDNNNFAAGKIFDPSKLMQNSAVDGDGLVYDNAAGIWKRTTDKPLRIAALAGYPSDGTKALFGDGTWKVTGAASVGTELDYKQITADVTGIAATTEGTAVAVITGNSVVYDATKKNIEVCIPNVVVTAGAPTKATVVVLRDTTVVGQFVLGEGAGGGGGIFSGTCFTVQDTPGAATFAYAAKVFVDSGTVTVKAGAGGSGNLVPAHLRVTKV